MVNWKLYIDAPQQRALDACYGSLTEGDAYSCGWGYIDGSGDGYGGSFAAGVGDGCGMGSGWCDDNGYCNGRSSTEW